MTLSAAQKPVSVRDPAVDVVPVVPNDTVDLPDGECRALIVTCDGALRILTPFGSDRTIQVPIGVLPIQAKRVFATGTTAQGITALY